MSEPPFEELVVPCPHVVDEGDEADHLVEVPNHYPLTKKGLKSLLSKMDGIKPAQAKLEHSENALARLAQGIDGMTCPRPESGEVAERFEEMKSLFIRYNGTGRLVEFAGEFDKILNG